MKSHALIFALFLLHVRAATIPDRADVEFEKKLTDVVKEVLNKEQIEIGHVSSEQELIDQAITVKDVENKLRNGVQVADIPVKVVVDEVKPVLKTDSEKELNNEVASENEENVDIKRVEIDLKNPGEPQRQEHDNQNPEHFEDGHEGLAAVKQEVTDSQNVFGGGFQGIQQNLQSWWANNQQFTQIQENIQQIQDSFQNQIKKLNETVQKIWQPNQLNAESPTKANVESSLKFLENNLKAGVKTLSDEVEAIATVREETKNETAVVPPAAGNPFAGYFQQLQQTIQQAFTNFTNNFNSTINNAQNSNAANNTATDGSNVAQNWGSNVWNVFNVKPQNSSQTVITQGDEGATTQKPQTFWQNIQNIFTPGQSVQSDTPVDQPAPNRPILNAIQNNPFLQGVANFIQPKPVTQAPVQKPQEPKPEASQEGSNAVPAESKPDKELEKEKPVIAPTAQSGPIKQLLEKNPVVQGIAGAVQRIQHTIVNPEKPRDAVEAEKGILVLPVPVHQSHGHGGPASGDNNDEHSSGVAVKSEPVIEAVEVPKEPAKEVVEEAKPSEIPDKTE